MSERLLVVACGALAAEVAGVVRANGWEHVEVRHLPAELHATPRRIAPALDQALAEAKGDHDRVFVAYADCGTTGAIDEVCERRGAERLPGAHCFAMYAGLAEWDALQEEEPGTFYLTDFFVRNFDAFVARPLGLDRRPDLIGDILGNYRRVVYLAQADDAALRERAEECAAVLGLAFEHRPTGCGPLARPLTRFVQLARVA
ncbi:MAG TPA: DUF1638 domain-containing protein [Gaiellaceae bacterium]|nr:DUF1638 domain-containing protein [Gaiellaceae bacterium]